MYQYPVSFPILNIFSFLETLSYLLTHVLVNITIKALNALCFNGHFIQSIQFLSLSSFNNTPILATLPSSHLLVIPAYWPL